MEIACMLFSTGKRCTTSTCCSLRTLCGTFVLIVGFANDPEKHWWIDLTRRTYVILCNRLRRANSDLGRVGIIVCASDEELGFERSTLEGRHSIIDDSHLRHFWRDVLASQEDLLRLLRLLGQCDRRQRLDADGVDLELNRKTSWL